MPFSIMFAPTVRGINLERLEIWEDDLWICDLVVDVPSFSAREVHIRQALSWLMETVSTASDKQDEQDGQQQQEANYAVG